MRLCDDAGPFDLKSICARNSWSSLIPAAFVLAICVSSIPKPRPIRRLFATISKPFKTFITLEEAEALTNDNMSQEKGLEQERDDGNDAEGDTGPPMRRTILMVFVGLVQSLFWMGEGSFLIVGDIQRPWAGISALLRASTWLYATVRPVSHPSRTAPYDLFALYFMHFVMGCLTTGGVIYDHAVLGISWPSTWVLVGMGANLASILMLLGVVCSMPVGVPSKRVKKEDIGVTVSWEDYTTLGGWITFYWIYPLVRKGRNETLNETDVWNLSPTIQARPIFTKYSTVRGSTLLRKLFNANSLDLIVDFVLTVLSAILTYAAPFFMKRILEAIDSDDQSPEVRANAYIYAFLAFFCALLKSQTDLQHLWFGRRACTRIRTELMATIYDKALKRKDFSGIIDKDKVKDAADAKAGISPDKAKQKADKGDEPRAGADVGKIVNLMASDANRVSMTVSAVYFIYGAPFEIIIGSVFLYQMLGWSAFAGFIVLLAGWPLNSWVAKRSIRIQKGFLTAKDKRMGVINELIGAIKFIKFFAWEDRWIGRALEARSVEMKWLVKARINTIFFYLLWNCSPILISIISFLVYVAQGKELTISVAFTSIALFNLIRQPLNVVPTWIIQVLQTMVALQRIATYLDEDEVSEQVSSLKKDRSDPYLPGDDDEGLGLANVTSKWNEVEEKEKGKGKDMKNIANGNGASTPADEIATIVGDTTSAGGPDEEQLDHHFELRDVTVMFPEGHLTVVTGPTASGKTALLMTLLGEMTVLKGKIVMSKNLSKVDEHGLANGISYAAQMPWLRHQSIKDNILFGYPYDEERYNQVIECCALKPDLDVFEDGDATEIGARGVSLSGGQKARVALARAVYARTKYVLLDDPLSAVDSHTARFLFEKLFQGPLLAHRTVILVTHHVELVLPGADYLVRMLDGRIDTQGTVKELRAQGVLDDIAHDSAVEVHQEEEAVAKEVSSTTEASGNEAAGDTKKPRKLIQDEHRETGGVRWSVYHSYLKASSYWIWACLALLLLVHEALGVSEKIWISIWGAAYPKLAPSAFLYKSFYAPHHELPTDGQVPLHSYYSNPKGSPQWTPTYALPSASEHPMFYVGIYAAIGIANALASVLSVIAQYTGALRASRILFKKLLETVVRATFRFHDTTPQGRMLNRFGKDIETIDMSLAGSLQSVNSSMATLIASILTVGVVFPLFLIPAFVIGVVYYQLAVGYLNTGRDLRRMESNSRSPIFSDFGELLEGIVTVRAFSAEIRFLDNLLRRIDVTTKMWYSFWMTNRWLLLNFDALGYSIVLITTLFALSISDAGLAGLCITSAMTFTMSIYWVCRMYTALELDLNSVERIAEYLDLPQEPPAIIEDRRPPAYWPSSNTTGPLIEVENLVVKYSPELPPVLQDVSFSLKPRERIGLLGRTGSGKSTLAMSILRFADPASGRILIDGIDISKIGLYDLRSRLTFIPQDATLFSGTLRENLDPFEEHTDSECLDVLFRVHLLNRSTYTSRRTSREGSRTPSVHGTDLVQQEERSPSVSTTMTDTDSKTTISLDTQVSAGGNNFSQGQRQLIAMARALLRRSSIIVLDEATSSIDFATDAKIQTTIREEFNDSLLLTIAHRLRTVIDYDRLIILDKGKIAEFDTPLNLIQKENGIFRNMCLQSGTFAELEVAAKAKAQL
ncbi:multidrug resistance-associated ABC transporter [Pleurotus eryngii]|uniref:Multidrug resistance-associated ABC transporter n=1 Tax=Pleurotus eryngii TaxID=5323 RepID=A0A9P6DCM7_PLEER|nr:multidrug resistance-associated ABC transporter [Pleurotus eryngii]